MKRNYPKYIPNNYQPQQQRPLRKVKFKKIDCFYLLDYTVGQDTEYINSLIYHMRINLINLYLKDLPEIKIDVDDIKQSVVESINSDEVLNDVCTSMHDKIGILRDNTNNRIDILFKILYKNDVYYVSINTYIPKGGGSRNSVDITIAKFDHDRKILVITLLNIDYDKDYGRKLDAVQFAHGTPIYMAEKERNLEWHIDHPVINNLLPDAVDTLQLVPVINHALAEYLNISTNGSKQPERLPFHHTSFEVKMYNKIYSSNPNSSNVLNVQSWQSYKCRDRNEVSLYIRKLGLHDIVKNPSMECPLVDFSDKEMKFVRKYVDDSNIFHDGEEAKNHINLHDVLLNPRYGKEMMIHADSDSNIDKMYLIHFTYNYNKDTDRFDMFIRTDISDDIVLYMVIVFDDIKNFRFSKSVSRFESMLYYKDKISLPTEMEDIKSILPTFAYDEKIILNFAADLISIYAVLHDRPKRSKVIRETTRVTEWEHTVKKPGKRDRVYGKKTEDFIIRRILTSAKEAKEYISKMVTEGQPNREYTLEEWDRAGHHRKKPHSNETIWIEPTKCHRRLPLSDKEVHIKL